MSLKTKLQPYIFVLGLIFSLFSFNNVLAFDYTPNTNDFVVNSFQYDNNGKLEISLQMLNQNTHYQIFTTPEPYFAGFQVNYILYTDNTKTNILSNFTVSAWYCNNTPEQHYIYGSTLDFYSIQLDEVKCYATQFQGSHGIINSNGITKTQIDSAYGTNYLENNLAIPNTDVSEFRFYPNYIDENWTQSSITGTGSGYSLSQTTQSYFPFTGVPPTPINGECGEAYGQVLTTIPPENSYACSSGTMIDFNGGLNELGTGIKYFWECEGSNGGYSVACSSAETLDVINGTCGTANGQTISTAPYEYEKCSYGATNGSTLQTLNGWTWSCYGFNGGSTSYCSAIYQEAETPPTIPETSIIPTPTDCETYSGIDKVLCNFGNMIQGMFLPSSEKIIELQTTMNEVGNVFPFNYLRAISSVFNNLNFSSGGLTMTIWGNTETLGADFWEMELFDNIKLGITILILLMFTFWAIGYIKHFFK